MSLKIYCIRPEIKRLLHPSTSVVKLYAPQAQRDRTRRGAVVPEMFLRKKAKLLKFEPRDRRVMLTPALLPVSCTLVYSGEGDLRTVHWR